MFQRGHLCGKIHKCKEYCNIGGFCFIEPFKETPQDYTSDSGQIISIKVAKIIEPGNYKCTIKVPENEYEHDNKNFHKCDTSCHICGHKCKQCNNFCTSNKYHNGLHHCSHTNIVNSKFSVEDNATVEVKINNDYYKIKDKEVATIFYCHEYCKEQGQGHTHLVRKSEINDINNSKVRPYNNDFYECKCSYFWESVLKFEHPIKNAKEIFDRCDCICPCKEDSPEIHNYCQLELWHGTDIPEDKKGNWVSPEGHKFKCDHPSGVYTIFLIDQSYSMSNDSIKPNGDSDISLSEKHNNMLGATIEALLKYCEIRYKINRREKCALIGYNNNASLIFKDYYVGEKDRIKEKCLSKLDADGGTVFEEAFKKAKEILLEINSKREYIPVIILLTDGIDWYSDKTIKYIKDDVSIII